MLHYFIRSTEEIEEIIYAPGNEILRGYLQIGDPVEYAENVEQIREKIDALYIKYSEDVDDAWLNIHFQWLL